MENIFCLESHIHLCSRHTSANPAYVIKHVSPGMRFLGLGIGGLSHQSCMSLHIGTNNIVGGSIITVQSSTVITRSNFSLYQYDTVIAVAESESDIRITTNTLYLALTGERSGVYCEDFGDCTSFLWRRDDRSSHIVLNVIGLQCIHFAIWDAGKVD